MTNQQVKRSKRGRARFGGGSAALLSAALIIGILISAGLGALFVWLSQAERPFLAFGIMTVVTLPVTAATGWAILVDRSTLTGAIDKPEDSIESAWYDKAASGAFGDVLMVSALGAAALGFTQFEASATLVLIAVVLLAMVDFAIRFIWLKKSAS